MIARLGVFDRMPGDIHAGYRRNLLERFKPALEVQEGFIAGYWLEAPDGRELSFTIWESDEALTSGALRANAAPLLPGQDGSKIPSPAVVETYTVVARAPGTRAMADASS